MIRFDHYTLEQNPGLIKQKNNKKRKGVIQYSDSYRNKPITNNIIVLPMI